MGDVSIHLPRGINISRKRSGISNGCDHEWASQVALVVKNPAANAGDIRDVGFDTWVRKIPWRRPWQPTGVGFPRQESHGQRSLAGYSPQGPKESSMIEVT